MPPPRKVPDPSHAIRWDDIELRLKRFIQAVPDTVAVPQIINASLDLFKGCWDRLPIVAQHAVYNKVSEAARELATIIDEKRKEEVPALSSSPIQKNKSLKEIVRGDGKFARTILSEDILTKIVKFFLFSSHFRNVFVVALMLV
jgi:hypothetical protein